MHRQVSQIVDRDSGNLYPIYPPFLCSDFLSQVWGGGGGVVLASEPVGGRSRATELPCLSQMCVCVGGGGGSRSISNIFQICVEILKSTPSLYNYWF